MVVPASIRLVKGSVTLHIIVRAARDGAHWLIDRVPEERVGNRRKITRPNSIHAAARSSGRCETPSAQACNRPEARRPAELPPPA
jgi:hypothetical protein